MYGICYVLLCDTCMTGDTCMAYLCASFIYDTCMGYLCVNCVTCITIFTCSIYSHQQHVKLKDKQKVYHKSNSLFVVF